MLDAFTTEVLGVEAMLLAASLAALDGLPLGTGVVGRA